MFRWNNIGTFLVGQSAFKGTKTNNAMTFILYFVIYSAVIRTLSTSYGKDAHLIKPALYSAISFNIGDVCGCAFLKSAVFSAIGPATTPLHTIAAMTLLLLLLLHAN